MFVVKAGGDVQRVFDGPWGSQPGSEAAEKSFLRMVGRLNEVVSGVHPPYIVLTRTNPIPLTVLAKRRQLCDSFPNLNKGLWILYLDPVKDPFFFTNAKRLGRFDSDPAEDESRHPLVVWYPNDDIRSRRNESYLVLTPTTVVDENFSKRIQSLLEDLSEIPSEKQTYTHLRAIGLDVEPPLSSRRR